MPNWTFNRVRVRGDDSKTIQEVKELFEGENPFNALIPEPDWTVTPLSELHENNSIFVKRGELGELPVQPDPNSKGWDCPKFASTGQQDDRWYDWRLKHWGTKWPACEVKITQDDTDFLEVTFDTAWCPPEEICQALRSKYENKSEESYSNGLFISVNWFYELEGEEGCGYL